MKNILILAYDFPPYNSIGSKRPNSWFNYFINYGYYPIVITRQWDNINNEIDCIKDSSSQQVLIEKSINGEVIRTPYKSNLRDKILIKYGSEKLIFLRKFLSFIISIFQYQSFIFDNKKNIYKEAKKYISKNNVDLIIVSVEPHIFLRYASKLSKKYKIPWIADYRDEWINRLNTNFLLKEYYIRLEKRYTRNVHAIFSASPNYSNSLSSQLKKKVYTITNGYEEIKFSKINNHTNTFKIGYVGSLYSFQPLEEYFKVLNKFMDDNPNIKIEFEFFGTNFISENWNRVLKINTHKNINIISYDRLNLTQLYEKLYLCSIVTLLASSEKIALAGKIFDYIYLKKKIVLFKNDHGILEEIMNECNAGIICDDEKSLYDTLQSTYKKWQENGFVSNNTINIDKYSRKELTKDFIQEIENLSA